MKRLMISFLLVMVSIVVAAQNTTPTSIPTYSKTPNYSTASPVALTQVASIDKTGRMFNVFIYAIQQEVINDPMGMGYDDMSLVDKYLAIKKRATDINPLTCLFNFGFPIDITYANVTSDAKIIK